MRSPVSFRIALRSLALGASLVTSLAVGPSPTRAQAAAEPVPDAVPVPSGYHSAPRVPPQVPAPSPIEQEYLESLRHEHYLLSLKPTALRPGWIVGGLGLATFIVGTAVFVSAYDPETGELNPAGDKAGLALMPIGALLIITGVTVLAMRARRRNRIARLERVLQGSGLSLRYAPSGPRGFGVGMTTRVAF